MASKRFRDAVGIDPDRVVSAAIDAALGEAQPQRKQHHPGRILAAGAAVAAAAAVGQRRMPRLAKVPLRMGLHKLGDMAHVDEFTEALRDRLAGREKEPADYYDDENLDDEDYDDVVDDDEELDEEPRDVADDQLDDEDEDEGFDDEDDEGFDDEPEDDDGPRGEGDEEPDEEQPEDDFDDDVEATAEDEQAEDEPVEDEPVEDEDELPEDEPAESDDGEDDEELDSDEDDDEQIAARSLDLGVRPRSDRRRAHDPPPDLFEALRTPHRRAPVMRRRSRGIDPAARPPEPGDIVRRNRARSGANKSKSRATRTKSTATRA